MAFVRCDCGAKISQYAEQCPSCGAPLIPRSDEEIAAWEAKVKEARRFDLKMWAAFICVLLFIGWLSSKSGDERKAEQEREFRESVNRMPERARQEESKRFWRGVGVEKKDE